MAGSRAFFSILAGLSAATPAIAQDEVFLGTIVLAPGQIKPISAEGAEGLDELATGEVDVTSAGIALSNPADLSELFVAEPTIAVGSAIPMSQKVYVQGIEENNLAISIDGARQNNKIFHHNTTTLIDPALLKAVRIDPGVAPADAGPGALGGSLAYETKDVADLLDPDKRIGGRFKTEWDSNGGILSNSLSGYGMHGGFEFLGFVKYAEGDERTDGGGDEIVGSGTDVLSGLAKVAYESETGQRIEFSMERVRDDESRPYRANIGAIIGGRPVPDTRPYDLERSNYVLTYTETAPQGWWDPKIQLAFSETVLGIEETDQSIDGSTESWSGVIQNRFALANGSVTAGVDFYSDIAETDYVYFPNAAWNESADERLRNIGLFAQARLEPTMTTRLSFGARADFQEFEGVDGSTQEASGLSGNLSGEWDVTERVTLSAGYSHVWGGLELAENFIMNPAWSYDDDIKEVTADNVYVAAAFAQGNWTVDGKLFSTFIDNARAASYGAGPALTADVLSQGYELGVGYAWDSGFARLGYARVETEVNGRTADSYTGNYLTMPMGEFITLQTAHRFDNGLLIGGDGQWALDYDNTYDFATGGSGPTIPGYALANAFVEYTPPSYGGLTLRAEVNNIFDEDYAARATYGQEFIGEVVPLTEPGRSFRISAEMRF